MVQEDRKRICQVCVQLGDLLKGSFARLSSISVVYGLDLVSQGSHIYMWNRL
jgi:hypothetical protein